MNLRKCVAMLLMLLMVLALAPGSTYAAPPSSSCPKNKGGHFWKITNQEEPNCTGPGYTRYKCAFCGQTYQETKPALGHLWGKAYVKQAATCTEAGYWECVCKRDKGHKHTTPIQPLGHDLSDWQVVKKASFFQEGLRERRCSRCDYTEQEAIPCLEQSQKYSLSLVMTRIYPDSPDIAYEAFVDSGENSHLATYSATLVNTGTEPLFVRDIKVNGKTLKGFASEYLEPGTSSTDPMSWTLFLSDVNGVNDDEDLYGKLSDAFSFYGDAVGSEKHVCESNAVTFDYNVLTPKNAEGWEPPVEAKSQVTITKAVTNASSDPNGFQLGETIEYEITVKNTGEVQIGSIGVRDALATGDPAATYQVIHNAMPSYLPTALHYSHTVDMEDVERGYVYNIAEAHWVDPDNGDHRVSYSNSQTVPVIGRPELLLSKTVVGGPTNGQYYVPGETVHFQITARNNTPWPLTVYVMEPLAGGSTVGMIDSLESGAEGTVHYDYTVTEMDGLLGSVVNYATAYASYGDRYVFSPVSNEVQVPTGIDVPVFPEVTHLTVTKKETSARPTENGYGEGNTISYAITVHNDGETMISKGTVHDCLKGGSGEIGSFENLNPGDTRTFHFSYVVSAQDAIHGKVINQAAVWYNHEGHGAVQASNTVESPTYPDPPIGFEFDDEPGPMIGGADDCCSRTLTGKGTANDAFTVHFCAEHLKLLEKLDAMKAAAVTEEQELAYLKYARAAWENAMDELYGAAQPRGAEAAPALMNQRLTWLEYADTYEAFLTGLYPDEPLMVARELLQQTQDRCVDLCYDLHEAPKPRVDSVRNETVDALPAAQPGETCLGTRGQRNGAELACTEVLCTDHAAIDDRITGLLDSTINANARANVFLRAQRMWEARMNVRTNAHYTAADQDSRILIARSRLAFDKYVNARKALLTVLYPDQAETVAQVVARLIQDKEMDLCRLWK